MNREMKSERGTAIERNEASMSIAEIIPAVQPLSRGEKVQLAQRLLEDLAC
jgi:hypothetical protein